MSEYEVIRPEVKSEQRVETVGKNSQFNMWVNVTKITQQKTPNAEKLLSVLNKFEANDELAESIEKVLQWRSKVKIKRTLF